MHNKATSANVITSNNSTMSAKKTTFSIDQTGTITSQKWCAEEGQYIVTIVGNVDDFSNDQLEHMNIKQK